MNNNIHEQIVEILAGGTLATGIAQAHQANGAQRRYGYYRSESAGVSSLHSPAVGKDREPRRGIEPRGLKPPVSTSATAADAVRRPPAAAPRHSATVRRPIIRKLSTWKIDDISRSMQLECVQAL